MDYKNINLKQIRGEAARVTKKYYKDAVPPIISEKAVFEEGLTIGFKELPNGKIAELDRKASTIYLTENNVLINQWGNFAIAHELGHWLLDDRPIDYFDPSTLTDDTCDKEDKAANYFAVSLLLPDNLMEEWKWLDEDIFRAAFKIPEAGITLKKKLV